MLFDLLSRHRRVVGVMKQRFSSKLLTAAAFLGIVAGFLVLVILGHFAGVPMGSSMAFAVIAGGVSLMALAAGTASTHSDCNRNRTPNG
ncbi:MAG: hypothetical protein AAFX09_02530 [Pseudomonadota bacterium]